MMLSSKVAIIALLAAVAQVHAGKVELQTLARISSPQNTTDSPYYTPVLAGDMYIAILENGAVAGFNLSSQTLQWNSTLHADAKPQSIVLAGEAGSYVLVSGMTQAWALEVATGKELWHSNKIAFAGNIEALKLMPCRTVLAFQNLVPNTGRYAGFNNLTFIKTYSGEIIANHAGSSGYSGLLFSRAMAFATGANEGTLFAFNGSTGKQQWSRKLRQSRSVTTGVRMALGDSVLVGEGDNTESLVTVFDATSGVTTGTLPNLYIPYYSPSPHLAVDNTVYATISLVGKNGGSYIAKIDTKKAKVVWRTNSSLASQNCVGFPGMVAADQVLFACSQALYAFDASTGSPEVVIQNSTFAPISETLSVRYLSHNVAMVPAMHSSSNLQLFDLQTGSWVAESDHAFNWRSILYRYPGHYQTLVGFDGSDVVVLHAKF